MVPLEQRPPGDLDRLGGRVQWQLEAGVQVVGGNVAKGHGRRQPVREASTSASGTIERSPVARIVTSTPPAANDRGLTVRIRGMPSRSASVNLTPGDSSRSS